MANILVTGGTGFTGGALCKRLRSEGHRVVTFVRPTSKIDALRNHGIDTKVVDLGDAASVEAAFEDFDAVYHIAAAYRSEHAARDEFARINVEGTRHLLESARRHGIRRFVHCSTVGVQGGIDDPPADETYRVKPNDHYQESKLQGELLARSYFDAGTVPGAVIRPGRRRSGGGTPGFLPATRRATAAPCPSPPGPACRRWRPSHAAASTPRPQSTRAH